MRQLQRVLAGLVELVELVPARREGAEETLRDALKDSNLVKWQFRGVAQTGLMVPRRVRGEERTIQVTPRMVDGRRGTCVMCWTSTSP